MRAANPPDVLRDLRRLGDDTVLKTFRSLLLIDLWVDKNRRDWNAGWTAGGTPKSTPLTVSGLLKSAREEVDLADLHAFGA